MESGLVEGGGAIFSLTSEMKGGWCGLCGGENSFACGVWKRF